MVALAVPKFGVVPTINLARNILFEANDCLTRGDLIGASIRLREATRRQLVAMCVYYGVLPKPLTAKQIRKCKPLALVRMLIVRGYANQATREVILNLLCWADAALDYELVATQKTALEFDIDVLHDIIDECPCGESFERLHAKPPKAFGNHGGSDGDDADGDASAWKGGSR